MNRKVMGKKNNKDIHSPLHNFNTSKVNDRRLSAKSTVLAAERDWDDEAIFQEGCINLHSLFSPPAIEAGSDQEIQFYRQHFAKSVQRTLLTCLSSCGSGSEYVLRTQYDTAVTSMMMLIDFQRRCNARGGSFPAVQTRVLGLNRQCGESLYCFPAERGVRADLEEYLAAENKVPLGFMRPLKYTAPVCKWDSMLFLVEAREEAVSMQDFQLDSSEGESTGGLAVPSMPSMLRRMLTDPACACWYHLVAHSVPRCTLDSYLEGAQKESRETRAVKARLHQKIHDRMREIKRKGAIGHDWRNEPHNLAGLKYSAVVVDLSVGRELLVPSEWPTGLLLLLTSVFRMQAVQDQVTSWICIRNYMHMVINHYARKGPLDEVDWEALGEAHTWVPFPRIKHDNSPHLRCQNYHELVGRWKREFADTKPRCWRDKDGLSPEEVWTRNYVTWRSEVLMDQGEVFESEDHKTAVVTSELFEGLDHGGEFMDEEDLEFGQEWDDTYLDWNMRGFPLQHLPVGRVDLDLPALLRTSRCRVMESRNWMQSFYRQHGIWVVYFDEDGDLLCPGEEIEEDHCGCLGTPIAWSDWVKRNFELCRSHEDRVLAAKFIGWRLCDIGQGDPNVIDWDNQVTWVPPVHHWTPEAVNGIRQGVDYTGVQRVFSWVCLEEGKKTVFCHPAYWSGAMLLEAGEVVRASSMPLWDPEHPVRAYLSAMNSRSHLEPWFIHPRSPRSDTLFIRSRTQKQDEGEEGGVQVEGREVYEEMRVCDAQSGWREVEETGRKGMEPYVQITPSGQESERLRSSGYRGVVTPVSLSSLEVPERCVVKLDHLLRAEGERKQWHRKVRLKKMVKVAVTQWIPVNRVGPCISRPKKLRVRREERREGSVKLAMVLEKFHKMSIGEDGEVRSGVRGRRKRSRRAGAEQKEIRSANGAVKRSDERSYVEGGQGVGREVLCDVKGDCRGWGDQAEAADKEPPDPP
jgi:hypothetical protein